MSQCIKNLKMKDCMLSESLFIKFIVRFGNIPPSASDMKMAHDIKHLQMKDCMLSESLFIKFIVRFGNIPPSASDMKTAHDIKQRNFLSKFLRLGPKIWQGPIKFPPILNNRSRGKYVLPKHAVIITDTFYYLLARVCACMRKRTSLPDTLHYLHATVKC